MARLITLFDHYPKTTLYQTAWQIEKRSLLLQINDTNMARSEHLSVSPRAFEAIRLVDVALIHELGEWELRPLLPCLVRMALCQPLDAGVEWAESKKSILQRLSKTEAANSIVNLLAIDFHCLDADFKKELISRNKTLGPHPATESILLTEPINASIALDFEKADGDRRFRLFLNEYLSIQSQMRSLGPQNVSQATVRSSELFENQVFVDDVSDVMCIAAAELPSCIQINEVCETLLHVKNGPYFICRLVANFPEVFQEVCTCLIMNGDKQDEDTSAGRIRIQVLRLLCRMNPEKALVIRSVAVEGSRMPAFTGE